AQAAAHSQASELESSRQSWQCKICFAREVDAGFAGCGHMVCVACAAGLDKCPVCRKRSALIRLYK
ncbi:RING-type domain-containing protein, partial [Haematococcus lacustris]